MSEPGVGTEQKFKFHNEDVENDLDKQVQVWYLETKEFLERHGLKLTVADAAYLRLVIKESIEHNERLKERSEMEIDPLSESFTRLFKDKYGVNVIEYLDLFGNKNSSIENDSLDQRFNELITMINNKYRPESELL